MNLRFERTSNVLSSKFLLTADYLSNVVASRLYVCLEFELDKEPAHDSFHGSLHTVQYEQSCSWPRKGVCQSRCCSNWDQSSASGTTV